MKKEEIFSKVSTQHPNETPHQKISRIKSEKKEENDYKKSCEECDKIKNKKK